MSILVVEVVSERMIFATDRNITEPLEGGGHWQPEVARKVVRWPSDDILLGYVGVAYLGGRPFPEWLEERRADFLGINSLEEIASTLARQVEAQRDADEGAGAAEPMLIHIGSFELNGEFWVPRVWAVTNIYRLGRFGYLDFRKEYKTTEEFWQKFPDVDPSEIRDHLRVMAKRFQPFWFHQGIDLFTFNVLESAIKSSFKLLCEQHPRHDISRTLGEWSCHTKMAVLMYGAYHEAFYPPGEQYVGGGADVVSVPWPD